MSKSLVEIIATFLNKQVQFLNEFLLFCSYSRSHVLMFLIRLKYVPTGLCFYAWLHFTSEVKYYVTLLNTTG